MEQVLPVDPFRVDADPTYREVLARALLDFCAAAADHTELRRAAARVFPELGRSAHAPRLAAIVGQAATIRATFIVREEHDVTDARLAMTATDPLEYPESYGALDDGTRARIVAFCEERLRGGSTGPEALTDLLRVHGWPYSERTFYVGPWKAARLRTRRRGDAD